MDWLNYHHLLYFWTVAREGSVSRACEQLGLAQPTISGQLHKLEASLQTKLLQRAGRGLVLTEAGKVVFRYADEIFKLGQELQSAVKGAGPGHPLHLVVGTSDALPKLIIYRLLAPARRAPGPVHLVCREGKPPRLLADLASHHLDVVLSDTPCGSAIKVRAFNHLLGECGLSFFAAPDLARRCGGDFPRSLHRAPFLLPTEDTTLRRLIETWCRANRVIPEVRGELDDSALVKVFGQAGEGVFVMPSVIEREVCERYGVKVVGRAEEARVRFYAITPERRLKHTAVVALAEAARREVFV